MSSNSCILEKHKLHTTIDQIFLFCKHFLNLHLGMKSVVKITGFDAQ